MPPGNDIQAQTADGVTHSFPFGTPPEVVDKAIKTYVTQQGVLSKNAEPTQFEQDRPEGGAESFLSNVGDYVKSALPSIPSAVMHLNPVTGPLADAYDAAKMVMSAPGRAEREYKADAGMPVGVRALGTIGAALGPAAGVDPDKVRSVAETGDTPGVLGQMAIPAVGAAVGLGDSLGLDAHLPSIKGRVSMDPNYRVPGTPFKIRMGSMEPPAAIDPLAEAVKNRTAAYIPTRMPSKAAPLSEIASPYSAMVSTSPAQVGGLPEAQLPPAAEASTTGPKVKLTLTKEGKDLPGGIKGSVSKPSGRLVLTPEEVAAQARMQDIATRRASEHGMQYAAGMRPVGGGRVPLTPTGTETFEAPQPKSVWNPETNTWELRRN